MKLNIKKLQIKTPDINNLKEKTKEAKNKSIAILVMISLVLFLGTILIQSTFGSFLEVKAGTKLTDWAFVSGVNSEQISDENAVFKQATSENPVAVSSSKPYTHLYYTFQSSEKQCKLIITTNYSPIKVELNSNTIYDNGYGKQSVVGNCYNEIIIPASGSQQTVHIYMYSPLGFSFDAQSNYGESIINWQLMLAFATVAIGLFFVLTAVCLKNGQMVKVLAFSSTVIVSGGLLLIYALSNYTVLLSNPIWYRISISLNIIVASLVFMNVLLLVTARKRFSKIICGILPLFAITMLVIPFGIFFNIIMVLYAIAQIVLSISVFMDMSLEDNRYMRGIKLLQVVVLYLFLINIFNSVATVFGAISVAQAVFYIGIIVYSIIILIFFIKYVSIKSMLDTQQHQEVDYFSEFYDDISNLVIKLYSQTNKEEFIIAFCEEVMPIIKKNKEIELDINSEPVFVAAVYENSQYKIISNENNISNPDFATLEDSIGSEDCVIGKTYLGVRFKASNEEKVIAYIGNIKLPFESGFKNHFISLSHSAQAAFVNINLKFELFTVEEKLFVNLARIVEERSEETSTHLVKVSKIVNVLCRELGYSNEESKLIATAAMTHDIGKVAIPDNVLNKKGIYTDEERRAMKKHTSYGYNILSVSKGEFFTIAAAIAKEHHENYDGTGYYGMSGNDIDKRARIVKLADTFDALVSERCYKDAWSANDAIDYIAQRSGTEFDPEVVSVFLKCKDILVDISC